MATAHRPGLGRLHKPDPRDAGYPLRALIVRAPGVRQYQEIDYKPWRVLNQGSHGWCVGYGSRGYIAAQPSSHHASPSAPQIYHACKALDGMPNEEGSTVRAAAQALQKTFGLIDAYHWAQSMDDVLDWMLNGHGGLVIGINWYRRMFDPTPAGFVEAPPGDTLEGGHCIYVHALHPAQDYVEFIQSWGGKWGLHGRGRMTLALFERLVFHEDGECMAAHMIGTAP